MAGRALCERWSAAGRAVAPSHCAAVGGRARVRVATRDVNHTELVTDYPAAVATTAAITATDKKRNFTVMSACLLFTKVYV